MQSLTLSLILCFIFIKCQRSLSVSNAIIQVLSYLSYSFIFRLQDDNFI